MSVTDGTPRRRPLPGLVAEIIAARRRHRTLLVAIDGRGASGKSSFARSVRDLAPGSVDIVTIDDFYRPSAQRQRLPADEIGAAFDWRRLREEVLVPLVRDEEARYERYDWPTDSLAEWHSVGVGGVLLVEGNYVFRAELRAFYDLAIWIECPFEERLARGIARDGEASGSEWLTYWMPEEDRYVRAEHPERFADIVIDGGTHLGVDPAHDVVVLSPKGR